MQHGRPPGNPHLITVPSTDRAFSEHVHHVHGSHIGSPADLERRLRRIFPRVVVRERNLSGEAPSWYVYRDGGWRSPVSGSWWADESLPRVVVSPDGWLVEVNATAAGILAIEADEASTHHFTDFVVPGSLDDAVALFRVIGQGSDLIATVLLRPLTGDVIAVDLHTGRVGDDVVGVFRLAADVEVPAEGLAIAPPSAVATLPPTDVAFRGYVNRALGRMPEPTRKAWRSVSGDCIRTPSSRPMACDGSLGAMAKQVIRDPPSGGALRSFLGSATTARRSSSRRTRPPRRSSAASSSGITGRNS
jgi:hypothetical protein